MLLTTATLDAIARGTVRLAFRQWTRPTVRAGGTLTTPVGVLSIDRVDPVAIDDITEGEAAAAGHESLEALRAALSTRTEGTLYRIAFHLAGADPRIALRTRVPRDATELEQLRARLDRWDRASRSGPWTAAALDMIRRRPGVRAPDLAASVGDETKRFKARVRKLKELGLTESLPVGYRLSPRGEAVWRYLERSAASEHSAPD